MNATPLRVDAGTAEERRRAAQSLRQEERLVAYYREGDDAAVAPR